MLHEGVVLRLIWVLLCWRSQDCQLCSDWPSGSHDQLSDQLDKSREGGAGGGGGGRVNDSGCKDSKDTGMTGCPPPGSAPATYRGNLRIIPSKQK